MVSQDPSAVQLSPLEILQQFASHLASQRAAIAEGNWTALADVVPKLQHAMNLVQAYPGGATGLRSALRKLNQADERCISNVLEEAAADRLAAAELIRINLNRITALKSMWEHAALDASDLEQSNAGIPGRFLSRHV